MSEYNQQKIMEPIKAGSLLTITAGKYSSYEVKGVFKATSDIYPDQVVKSYLENGPSKEFWEDTLHHFFGWLVRQELLAPVDCVDWHLGDYSSFEEMEVSHWE